MEKQRDQYRMETFCMTTGQAFSPVDHWKETKTERLGTIWDQMKLKRKFEYRLYLDDIKNVLLVFLGV